MARFFQKAEATFVGDDGGDGHGCKKVGEGRGGTEAWTSAPEEAGEACQRDPDPEAGASDAQEGAGQADQQDCADLKLPGELGRVPPIL